MRATRSFRLAAAVALAAAAAACSDSTGPSNQESPDLSQVLAELQPSSIAPLAGQLSDVPATMFDVPVPSSCAYNGASRSFVCPNVIVSNVTVSRSFTLLDAAGTPQSAFDKATTAAVRLQTAMAGTVTSPSMTMTIDHHQDVTLSGLLTGVHTLNGTGLSRVTGTIGTGSSAFPIASTTSTTITNLVLPRSSSGNPWPQSGTIASTITEDGLGLWPATSNTITVTIAFNGTSTATVTIAGDGASYSFPMDLAHPGPIRG